MFFPFMVFNQILFICTIVTVRTEMIIFIKVLVLNMFSKSRFHICFNPVWAVLYYALEKFIRMPPFLMVFQFLLAGFRYSTTTGEFIKFCVSRFGFPPLFFFFPHHLIHYISFSFGEQEQALLHGHFHKFIHCIHR